MTISRIVLSPELELSRMVLGLWRLAAWGLEPPALIDFVQQCLDLGLTSFDEADIYGDYQSEALFGRMLAAEPGLRPKMQIITKCGIKLISGQRPANKVKSYDTSRAHILASVDNSLQVMNTDYIDLLLIHRPDPLMDADEVAEAFRQLQQAGKVRAFGVSNFLPHQFELLASRLDFPLVTNQVELSVAYMEPLHNGIIDQCQQRRIPPMAWSPLGGGGIFSGQDEQSQRLRAVLGQVGDELGGAGIDQVALAWLLSHPAQVIPVLGTGKIERIHSAAAAEALALSREQWFAIWQASTGQEVP